jgi:Family of unknown function (DUF6011)
MNFDFNDAIPDFGGGADSAPLYTASAPVTPIAPAMAWFSAPAHTPRQYGGSGGNGGRKASNTGERHACEKCGGTGRYRGVRVHQPESRCFHCNGRGYFKSSASDRAQARQSAHDRKAALIREARESFDRDYAGVAAWCEANASWNNFAREMCEKLAQYGYLTDGQAAAIVRMREKTEATRAARQCERTASAQVVDLSPIRAMFESANRSGYKAPIYRAAGLVINRAPDHGRNPGALYVKTADGDYLGKILGCNYTGKPAPALALIALDPRGEAIRYGQKTGNCSCCGRTLTAEGSVAAGIGPICAEKWGL